MNDQYGREALESLNSRRWKAQAAAQDAWEKGWTTVFVTTPWALSGAFLTKCILEISEASKKIPDLVEYPMVAMGGIAAALYISTEVGGTGLTQRIKTYRESKRIAAALEIQHSRLKPWVEGPRSLSIEEELSVRNFSRELGAWNGETK